MVRLAAPLDWKIGQRRGYCERHSALHPRSSGIPRETAPWAMSATASIDRRQTLLTIKVQSQRHWELFSATPERPVFGSTLDQISACSFDAALRSISSVERTND